MRSFRTSTVLLLILIVGNTLAWDGCNVNNWRCGDVCIHEAAKCTCGGETFNHKAQMWCCQDSPCTGTGTTVAFAFSGETGADCTGTALNLTQACNQTCNYYEEDPYRNVAGVRRSYAPCQVDNLTTTQCIPEAEVRDGKFDCRNRGDEEAFPKLSSLLLDLDNILTPCTDYWQGFKCSTSIPSYGLGPVPYYRDNCTALWQWCTPEFPFACDELAGITATGKTIDPQICSNQTFWTKQMCGDPRYYRCTGKTSGECWGNGIGSECSDGSHEIKPAGTSKEEEGDCGEQVKCTARDGKWAGEKICLEKRFKCDGYVQCEDAEDEINCEEKYMDRKIFTRDQRHICRSPFLEIKNKTSHFFPKFFPMRAIRCSPIIVVIIIRCFSISISKIILIHHQYPHRPHLS